MSTYFIPASTHMEPWRIYKGEPRGAFRVHRIEPARAEAEAEIARLAGGGRFMVRGTIGSGDFGVGRDG